MFKVQGWVENGNITVSISGTAYASSNKVQGSFPSGTVTVYAAGTLNLSSIYSDDATSPTVKANPFTADSSGQWFFYAAPGLYDIKFSGGGISVPFTIGGVQVGLGGGGIPSYALASLPTSKTQNAGNLARVTDSRGGLWMDSGTQWSKVYPVANIKDAPFNAVGDGVTLDDAAFVLAAALGLPIALNPGDTYYVSTTLTITTGTHFICPNGIATIKFKTGAGGFNLTTFGVTGAVWFGCTSVDNVGLENLRFTTDGAKEVCMRPVRTSAGLSTIGARFVNLEFIGMSIGVMVDIATAGAGGYYLRRIIGRDCGTAQGSGYWTGGVQLTLVQYDDDIVGGVYSDPGVMEDLRAYNMLFSGAALTDFGMQTDLFNHAGALSNKPGPIIRGVYADGVGEVIDIFGMGCVITGVQIKSCYYYGVKFIHSAQYNYVEVDYIGAWGVSAVSFQGSASFTQDTAYNVARVGVATGGGTITVAGFDASVVSMGDNSGGPATCLPKSNYAYIDNAIGNGTDLDYIVRDACLDDDNDNLVEVAKVSGWAVAFCTANPDNTRIRVKDSTEVILNLPGDQAIATATPTVVDFSTVIEDRHDEAVPASDKVRCKFPGRKFIDVQLRITNTLAGDLIAIELLRNGGSLSFSNYTVVTDGDTYSFQRWLYIAEDWVSSASADIQIRVTITSAGGGTVYSNGAYSYFSVTDFV